MLIIWSILVFMFFYLINFSVWRYLLINFHILSIFSFCIYNLVALILVVYYYFYLAHYNDMLTLSCQILWYLYGPIHSLGVFSSNWCVCGIWSYRILCYSIFSYQFFSYGNWTCLNLLLSVFPFFISGSLPIFFGLILLLCLGLTYSYALSWSYLFFCFVLVLRFLMLCLGLTYSYALSWSYLFLCFVLVLLILIVI